MPLYNIKKKLNKAASRLGLPSGEEVIAACMTFPYGHKRKAMVRGAVGSVAVMMNSTDSTAHTGDAAKMPDGQHFIGVTPTRLIATTVKSVSTNPKELVAEWPIEDVHNITVERHAPASEVTVHFIDGSVLQLDGMHGSGAADLHNILGG